MHWSKDVRFDKIAEGFGCYGEYVERARTSGPRSQRAYASGKPASSTCRSIRRRTRKDMPNYDEFRTWYAEGTQ